MRFLRETFIVFRRQLRMNLRNPAWVIIGLTQPVLYLFLFGPLLKPFAAQLGFDNAYTLFVPGLLIQLGVFGAFFAGFGLIAEWREGVVEAERVTPASRTALLMGRLLRDVLLIFVQTLVLVGLGYVVGMDASLGGAVLGVGLTLLLGGACSAASYGLALTTKSEDVMAPILNSIFLPVLLLSGILHPDHPGAAVARSRPATSCRSSTSSTASAPASSATSPPPPRSGAPSGPFVLTAVAVWWGTSTFRKENA